jgi:uncharacterized protein (TIGR03086 family)
MTSSTFTTTHNGIDPRPILERAIAAGAAVVAAVRPDQLTASTPCGEMDVRTMLGHLVGVLDRIGALGRGEDPFAVTESLVPDDGWSDAWAASSGRVADAWRDDAVLEQPMALPWVQGTGADVLTSYFSELTVHTWDLATATGQDPDWDDAVVAASLAAGEFLPAENRLALFEEVSTAMGLDEVAVPFAEAIAVPDDAPAIDRLVAWNGRDPRH